MQAKKRLDSELLYNRLILKIDNAHGHGGHATDNFRLVGISVRSNLQPGNWVGNDVQLAPVQLAPAANVAVAQFNKVDGAIMFTGPRGVAYLVLAGVDLDKRPWPYQRVQGEILKSNEPVQHVLNIQVLQHCQGKFLPGLGRPLKHPRLIQTGIGG